MRPATDRAASVKHVLSPYSSRPQADLRTEYAVDSHTGPCSTASQENWRRVLLIGSAVLGWQGRAERGEKADLLLLASLPSPHGHAACRPDESREPRGSAFDRQRPRHH